MTNAQQDFVSRAQNLARTLSYQYGEICALNALWYGQTADYQNVITDPELQGVAAFAQMTHAELNEVLYIIGQLKGLMDARLEPLAVVTL